MAFSATITGSTVFGNKRIVYGTYAQGDGDTGGAVDTKLGAIAYFEATAATDISVSGGVATVTTADPGGDVDGFFMAIGA